LATPHLPGFLIPGNRLGGRTSRIMPEFAGIVNCLFKK